MISSKPRCSRVTGNAGLGFDVHDASLCHCCVLSDDGWRLSVALLSSRKRIGIYPLTGTQECCVPCVCPTIRLVRGERGASFQRGSPPTRLPSPPNRSPERFNHLRKRCDERFRGEVSFSSFDSLSVSRSDLETRTRAHRG